MTSVKTVEEYLREPYSRVVIPDNDVGGFTSQILEFPGCLAEGDSLEEAYKNLEEVAKSWIQAALDLGQSIPEPFAARTYNGKIALRVPKTMHKQAVEAAEREGVSLNQFIVVALAEKLGASAPKAQTNFTKFVSSGREREPDVLTLFQNSLHYGQMGKREASVMRCLVFSQFPFIRSAATDPHDVLESAKLRTLVVAARESARKTHG